MSLDTAPGRHQRSANQLQQGGFATAVTADDTDGFAPGDGQGHIVQGPELAIETLPAAHQHLQQAVLGCIVNLITLAQVFGADGHFKRHRQNPSMNHSHYCGATESVLRQALRMS
ncbi:hypothetical protein D3C76_1308640 [compost metagenome]